MGIPKRRLDGHSHFVSDVVISSDGRFCLSGSWDGTLRLWDLASGNTTRRFIGHTKDVLSVAFSADNRQIVSAARDRTIKLWNTLGICKYTIQEQGHTEWVSGVRFSPLPQNPVTVSSGWDKLVKVWNLPNSKLSLRSSNLKLWDSHLSASPSAGAQTDRHFSPDTPMDSSVSGHSLSAPAPSSKLNQPFRHVLTRLVGNTVNFIDVY